MFNLLDSIQNNHVYCMLDCVFKVAYASEKENAVYLFFSNRGKLVNKFVSK